MRDLVGHLAIASSIDPDDYTATATGAIIDLQGFDSMMVSILVGTLTDGVHTPKLVHGNESNLSDVADVAAIDLDGEFAAVVSDTNQAVGYLGNKRYCRIVITISGGPGTGAQMSGAIIRNKANLSN
jgi:hypothetical protein